MDRACNRYSLCPADTVPTPSRVNPRLPTGCHHGFREPMLESEGRHCVNGTSVSVSECGIACGLPKMRRNSYMSCPGMAPQSSIDPQVHVECSCRVQVLESQIVWWFANFLLWALAGVCNPSRIRQSVLLSQALKKGTPSLIFTWYTVCRLAHAPSLSFSLAGFWLWICHLIPCMCARLVKESRISTPGLAFAKIQQNSPVRSACHPLVPQCLLQYSSSHPISLPSPRIFASEIPRHRIPSHNKFPPITTLRLRNTYPRSRRPNHLRIMPIRPKIPLANLLAMVGFALVHPALAPTRQHIPISAPTHPIQILALPGSLVASAVMQAFIVCGQMLGPFRGFGLEMGVPNE